MKKIVAIAFMVCIIITMLAGCKQSDAGKTPDMQTPSTEASADAPAVQTEMPATSPVQEMPVTPLASPESKADMAEEIREKPVEAVKDVEPAKTEENKDSITFVDSLGKTLTLKKNPQRVVCLYTSYLDLWDMSGGKVVGRIDTKENVPEAAKNVETVGLYTNPNLEKILALQPDLVLINSDIASQVALIPMLESSKIPYVALKYDTFKDYLKILKIYTELTDREDLYQSKGIAVAQKVDAILAKVPRDRVPSVLLLLGSTKSVSVRLPDTTVGEMLKDLGAVNIAYDPSLSAADMQVFSMERVIEKNPDFIFAQTMGDVEETTARIKKDVESNPAWSYLTAVKEGRYIFLPKDLFLFKPNDRYAEAYEQLAKILYPDIFN
ncbi:MAG: transporter substrate-binding protein [Clostridia bacterium]|jgi:iron complex transport system substrate-binding protein|nr:transporter substrate-binding protein [Clostridia bacterium]